MPSLTITVSQANLPRLLAAFSVRADPAGNPIPADAETVRTAIMDFVKQRVKNYESGVAQQQAAATISEVDIT